MTTWNDLAKIREANQPMKTIRLAEQTDIHIDNAFPEDGKIHVMICAGTGCQASDSHIILEKLIAGVEKRGMMDRIEVHKTGCFGLCEAGPNIVIFPQGIFYSHVKVSDVERILQQHFTDSEIIEDLLYKEAVTGTDLIHPVNRVDFYSHQTRIALANCGVIDPENIDEYIALDGYLALEKVLTEMTPEDVIRLISDSGLRGRGGAGFPTGRKWQFTASAEGDKKYVACNADEGDPGAFMDRSILEGDPHCIIEAMLIAAYAVGADEGHVYVRAEYPVAVNRLQIAIDQAIEHGLLGKNIMGTDFSFDLHIRLGAGAFVCGEETALIESIEGKRGMPRTKPPFPATMGIYNKPTLINNVETYANICPIIRNGAQWFRQIGTETSPGTKVFSLGGKVVNSGLIEVPMGTTFRTVIEDIGGGIIGGKKFKAVQTGGPSGGCIPAEHIDAPIDFESLKKLGSMMGSGGMIAMDEDNCMVDIAKFYLEFTVDESCGKCTPCRVGNKRLLESLTRITEGRAEPNEISKMKNLAETIIKTSACGLGQSSPNPVLSTLKYFEDEYLAHTEELRCPAGVCKKLVIYEITDDCIGCTKCKRNCPVNAISGELKDKHEIDQNLCIKCGQCIEACPKHAIDKK